MLIAAVLTLAEGSGEERSWHKALGVLLAGAAGALGAHLAAEAAAPAPEPPAAAQAPAEDVTEQVGQSG